MKDHYEAHTGNKNNVELADVHFMYSFCDRNSRCTAGILASISRIGENLTMFEVMHLNVRKSDTLMPHACLSWKDEVNV